MMSFNFDQLMMNYPAEAGEFQSYCASEHLSSTAAGWSFIVQYDNRTLSIEATHPGLACQKLVWDDTSSWRMVHDLRAVNSVEELISLYGTHGISLVVMEYVNRSPSFKGDIVLRYKLVSMLADLERALTAEADKISK
jgi:hypothetical protein